MNSRNSQRGFTLIEVVVALAVFALCVGALLESFRGAALRGAQTRAKESALLVAQSVLARIRATESFAPEQSGEDGSLSWRVAVAPEQLAPDAVAPFSAYRVVVSVFDNGDEPRAVLRSIELGRKR